MSENEACGEPAEGPMRARHPASPKASARIGVRRFPRGLRNHLDPQLSRKALTDAVAESGLATVAKGAALISHAAGTLSAYELAHSVPALAELRNLWPVRRIGGHREAPNRVGFYVREQDGYRVLLETESQLEKSHLRDLEFNHGAEWLMTQPLILRWTVDGRHAWRVPDILGIDGAGAFVADVKPEEAQSEFTLLMFELTRQTLANAGFGYRVLGSLSRQKQNNLSTIASARWPNSALTEALVHARTTRRRTLGGVIDSAGGGGVGEATAMHLLSKELQADLDAALTQATPVTWGLM